MYPPPKEEDLIKNIYYNDRPFGWAGGSPFLNLCRGETRVFTDSSVAIRGNDTERIWEIIKSEKCTHAALIPYFLADLLRMKDTYKDPFKLRAILTGGQIVEDIYTQVVGVFAEVMVIGYGSTETWFTTMKGPITSGVSIQSGHVGNVIPGLEMKILDENLDVTELGKSGEIFVRSSLLSNGYFLNEKATREAFFPVGWFKTGDRGFIKEDGTVVVEGRVTEVISRGTRKIMPDVVEEIILKMDKVLHTVVVAVPDKRLYEEVCACFVVKEGCDVTEKEVEDYCKEKMLKTETLDGLGIIPTYYLKFESFPCLFTGKPHKRKIKQTALDRLGLSKMI